MIIILPSRYFSTWPRPARTAGFACQLPNAMLRQLLTVLLLSITAINAHASSTQAATNSKNPSIKFGVLGDSDSHSFHDGIILSDPALRGGTYRDVTYQWTEIIARLRPQQIDMGAWGKWGAPGRIAAVLGMIGLEDRAPRKQDYRYNLAISGAKCENLTRRMSRQTQRLVYLMDQEPQAWTNGIITIRIGINNLGMRDALERFARDGLTREAQQQVTDCATYVRDSVGLIRNRHPATRIVLIGIFDNANAVDSLDRWQQPQQLQNIATVLDAYDAELKQLAMNDPNILFWDERAWFAKQFGGRDSTGKPNYRRTQTIGSITLNYTQGDAPTNAVVADGHIGTVWNGLWARDLLQALNQRFGYAFHPIMETEISTLADPQGKIRQSRSK
jgi:hypothetical protein